MSTLTNLRLLTRPRCYMQFAGRLNQAHHVRYCSDKRQVDVTSSKQMFMFDTLALSNNLQKSGFTMDQAHCICEALVQITSSQMDFIHKNMVTKPQQEILLQQILSQIGSVKKDMIILEKSEFSSLKHEYEQQNSEIQEVRRHFQDEVTKVKSSVQLDLNLEKSRARDAHAENEKLLAKVESRINMLTSEHDKHLSGLNSKIEKEIATLLATYERYRNDIIKYSGASERARSSFKCQSNVFYGPTSRQKYDILTDESTPQDAPIVVYIHGGYWHLPVISAETSCFAAEPIIKSARAVFIAVDYELCPEVSMTEIVDQVHAAVCHIQQLAIKRGSRGIFLVGHSAGAHLAAIILDMMQTTLQTAETQADMSLIKGLVLFGGIYDLRPMLETKENADLRMTEQEAWSLSPINSIHLARLQPQHSRLDVILVIAENDTPAFRQQSLAYQLALLEQRIVARLIDVKDTDHFDIVERLTDTNFSVTKMIVSMLQEHRQTVTIDDIVSHCTD